MQTGNVLYEGMGLGPLQNPAGTGARLEFLNGRDVRITKPDPSAAGIGGGDLRRRKIDAISGDTPATGENTPIQF